MTDGLNINRALYIIKEVFCDNECEVEYSNSHVLIRTNEGVYEWGLHELRKMKIKDFVLISLRIKHRENVFIDEVACTIAQEMEEEK